MSTQYVPQDHETSGEAPRTVDARGRKLGLAHRLYVGDVSWDFIARRKLWFAISGALMALSLGALLLMGLRMGIEFKGGADFAAPAKVSATTVEQVRGAVVGTGLKDLDSTQVTTIGDNQVRVQTRSLAANEVNTVRDAIAKSTGDKPGDVTYSLIGASWGQQITHKAIQALAVFLGLVALLIWAYFRDWKMSVAALVALVHDLLLTVGIYALVGFTVTPATMIGVLTIMGYSLYDTVVVFDKVKENVRGLAGQRRTYSEAANAAINQVLVRSLNTTLIGVLPVAALLFAGVFVLGSGPLEDLGLALFIGMIAGAYSSIFIATPLLAWLKEKEPAMREHRAALDKRARRARQDRLATAEPLAAAATATTAAAPARTERTQRTTRTSRANRTK